MKKFQLEMGGKNPLVVLDDADLKIAVELRRQRRLLLDRPALHRLLAPDRDRRASTTASSRRWSSEMRKASSSTTPSRHGTQIGPVVDQNQLDQDLNYIKIAKDEGAKLAFGGDLLNRETPGFYLQPALITETTTEMRINREEVFGPVASVIRVKDYDEALARRQRHRLRPVVRHLHHLAEVRRRTSSATRRPAW